jgi:hypothetical protein
MVWIERRCVVICCIYTRTCCTPPSFDFLLRFGESACVRALQDRIFIKGVFIEEVLFYEGIEGGLFFCTMLEWKWINLIYGNTPRAGNFLFLLLLEAGFQIEWVGRNGGMGWDGMGREGAIER